jgi:hypothetical protein
LILTTQKPFDLLIVSGFKLENSKLKNSKTMSSASAKNTVIAITMTEKAGQAKQTEEPVMTAKEKLNATVQKITEKIRGKKRGWSRGHGICEWCGLNPAKHNLDLKHGSHRECDECWLEEPDY